MKFYTADEHYGHANILKFCKRPFSDLVEMREALIAAHNAKVGRGDLTYHVGDMFWKNTPEHEAIEILNRLNGQHILVWGNHDEVVEKSPAIQTKFLKIADVLYLPKTDFAPKMFLCHYAMRVWRNSHNGSYHLYGHSHAALPEANTLSFDVGVDSRPDFAPWSEAEVIEKMKAKQAAGAADPMTAVIVAESWNKAEGAEVPYPNLPLVMPVIPQSVWDAIKENDLLAEESSGSTDFPFGRCVE